MNRVEKILKEFDEEFSEKGTMKNGKHIYYPNLDGSALKKDIKAFLKKHLEEIEEEYAHPNKPGWCCACDFDQAFLVGMVAENCKCKSKEEWDDILFNQ